MTRTGRAWTGWPVIGFAVGLVVVFGALFAVGRAITPIDPAPPIDVSTTYDPAGAPRHDMAPGG